MTRVEKDDLDTFVTHLTTETGANDTAADSVAQSLVSADLRGHHSHGSRLLHAKYLPEIKEGKINPTADPSIESDHEKTAVVNGNQTFGQVVGRTAVETVCSKVSEHGIGAVGLRNTSHIGRIGEWGELVTDAGYAFIGFVSHPNSRWVTPAGSTHPRLSTNPICLGIPTFNALDFPLILDMATSQVAVGKVRYYAAKNEELPEEWVLDSSGEYLRDGNDFARGETPILPLGGLTSGYKGFALSVMMELFSTNIGDSFISGEEESIWGNAASFIAVDLTEFTTKQRIEERVTAYTEYLRATESGPHSAGDAAYGEDLLLPGEAEYEITQEYERNGISLPESDYTALRELANEYGILDVFPEPRETDRVRERE